MLQKILSGGGPLFSSEATTLMRSVLAEVCERVGKYDNGTRTHVASKLLEAAARGPLTIEDLKRTGREALAHASLMRR